MAILVPRVFKLLTLVACATAAYSSAAQAVDNTRYISITGNDASDCTLAAPCRNLPRGKNSTPAGGELRILDSGDYGNSGTVNKSLTISGNGNTVFLRNPIIIDNANAVVTLRGLTLNGQGTIANGISIVAAAVVHIENCVVHNFSQDGIIGTADWGLDVCGQQRVARQRGRWPRFQCRSFADDRQFSLRQQRRQRRVGARPRRPCHNPPLDGFGQRL